MLRGEPGLWLLQSSEGFFHDEVDRRGRTVTSTILRAERGALPAWACKALTATEPGAAATHPLAAPDGREQV